MNIIRVVHNFIIWWSCNYNATTNDISVRATVFCLLFARNPGTEPPVNTSVRARWRTCHHLFARNITCVRMSTDVYIMRCPHKLPDLTYENIGIVHHGTYIKSAWISRYLIFNKYHKAWSKIQKISMLLRMLFLSQSLAFIYHEILAWNIVL